MHRSGKEEAVCGALGRILHADAREGREWERRERLTGTAQVDVRGGAMPLRRWEAARAR